MAILLLFPAACSPPQPQASDFKKESPVRMVRNIPTVHIITAPNLERLITEGRNKVVVINFWATWCAPCVAEMPELSAFYHEHKSTDLLFLALSLDLPDEIETKVKPFARDKDIPFPVYILAERDLEVLSKIVRHELSGVLPTTLVIDRKGAVAQNWEGAITTDQLNQIVVGLL